MTQQSQQPPHNAAALSQLAQDDTFKKEATHSSRCCPVLTRQGFLPGKEREGEGTNLDTSEEGKGTSRCRRRHGQRTGRGFLQIRVRSSRQPTFNGSGDQIWLEGALRGGGKQPSDLNMSKEAASPAATIDTTRHQTPPSRQKR